MPDVAYLVAKDIHSTRSLKPEFVYWNFLFLQSMCKPGAISFTFEKNKYKCL